MKTKLFYFSGTGNSLWVAKLLAQGLGDAELLPMAHAQSAKKAAEGEAVGLVFPVHMWGVPRIVLEFVDKMQKAPGTYYFALAVHAGQVSRTLLQLSEHFIHHGIQLSAGFEIKMPSNYIPWGGPGPQEEMDKRFAQGQEKIKRVVEQLALREALPLEKGPLWQRILFTAIYKLTFKQVATMDKKFTVDSTCNGCGLCARLCPTQNIAMAQDRPQWQHNCEQCLACIQWCPQKAIQMNAKTASYPRYHQPQISLADMLDQV